MRLILLTGSPLRRSLDWEQDALDIDLLPAFGGSRKDAAVFTVESTCGPAWRFLPLGRSITGLNWRDNDPGPTFEGARSDAGEARYTSTSLDGEGHEEDSLILPSSDVSEQLTQYYEHSLALHEELPSSQIIGPGSEHGTSFSSDSEEYSFQSSELSIGGVEKDQVQARLQSALLSTLKEIPKASHLQSIQPQTMSVNLVVGVISVAQPRAIRTRKGGRMVELVEMTCGDETRSGFGINIWLPSLQHQDSDAPRARMNGQSGLRDTVLSLRPRDIILVRRAGLSSFRGIVYGQSLRKGMTTVDLLYRSLVDASDIRGAFKAREIDSNLEVFAQVVRVKRVKDWIMHFVGVSSRDRHHGHEGGDGDCGEQPLLSLPLDTQ